jgi:hypothetical protein
MKISSQSTHGIFMAPSDGGVVTRSTEEVIMGYTTSKWTRVAAGAGALGVAVAVGVAVPGTAYAGNSSSNSSSNSNSNSSSNSSSNSNSGSDWWFNFGR